MVFDWLSKWIICFEFADRYNLSCKRRKFSLACNQSQKTCCFCKNWLTRCLVPRLRSLIERGARGVVGLMLRFQCTSHQASRSLFSRFLSAKYNCAWERDRLTRVYQIPRLALVAWLGHCVNCVCCDWPDVDFTAVIKNPLYIPRVRITSDVQFKTRRRF